MTETLPELLTPQQQAVLDDCEARIRAWARMTVEAVVRMGFELERAKRAVGHGAYERWLINRLGMVPQTAWRYVLVHRFVAEKSLTVRDLEPVELGALYLLVSPSTPEAIRDQALHRASRGERVTHAAIKAALNGDEPLEPQFPFIRPLSTCLSSIAMLGELPCVVALAIEPPLRPKFAERAEEGASYLTELAKELRRDAT